MKPFLKFLVTSTVCVAVLVGHVQPTTSAAKQRFTKVLPGQAPRMPGVSVVRSGSAVELAMTTGQTGVFLMHRASLAQDGIVETIGIVENGRLMDLLARRNGVILRRTHSTLQRLYTKAQYTQLMSFGINQPVTVPALKERFLQIGRSSGTAPASPPAHAIEPPCPADYNDMNAFQKFQAMKRNAYHGCDKDERVDIAPTSFTMAMTKIALVSAAYAADWSIIFFEVNANAFFSSWGFEYEANQYFAFNIGGIRAIWAVTG